LIRITTLIENTKGEHLALKNEHGISFHVEANGRTVLFDTGQSGTFLQNAEQLRIDLTGLEFVALSHGHYDHSGGLLALSEKAKKFEVVVGKGFFEEKYAALPGGGHEFLGNNFSAGDLRTRGIRFSEMPDSVKELVPGVFAMGNFPRIHPDEVIRDRFKLLKDGVFTTDRFDDEIMLVVDTPKGLVAILGCSHPGMRNMLDAVKSHFNKHLYAVLGGTHLVEAAPGAMKASIDYLENSDLDVIGVSHCTGAGAMTTLGETESRYFHNRTGTSLIIA